MISPRRWLEDGKRIAVKGAPTAFGPVAVSMESRLSRGEVIAVVALPSRQIPTRTLLRARVPDHESSTRQPSQCTAGEHGPQLILSHGDPSRPSTRER